MGGGYEDRRGSKRPKRDDDENQMCRDFDKGTCFRGDRCKFRHPSEGEGNSTIPFCKDFRAGVCKFRDCVYVHGPPLLEEEYMKTGWVPRFVLKHCLDRFNLCIQFLKEDGVCTKGESCKYGHTTLGLDLDKSDFNFSSESNHEMNSMAVCRSFGLCKEFIKDKCSISGSECKYKHSSPQDVGMGNGKSCWADVLAREGVEGYVRNVRGGLLDGDMMNDGGMRGGNMGNMMGGGGMMGGEEMMMLRQENEMLRMEMENLRKQNEGMKATNQFLLEENASMRAKMMETQKVSSVKPENFGGIGQSAYGGANGGFSSGMNGNGGYGGSTSGFGGGNGSTGSGGYGGSSGGGRGEYNNGGGFNSLGGRGNGFGSFQSGVRGGGSGYSGRGSSGGW